MKKIALFLTLVSVSMITIAGGDEEVVVTGTPPSQPTWDPDWQRKYNEEQARRAAEEDARRRSAYLAAEAAAKRETQRKQCINEKTAEKTLCQLDYSRAHTAEVINCGKAIVFPAFVEQCNLAAQSQLNADLLSCDLTYQTNVSKC